MKTVKERKFVWENKSTNTYVNPDIVVFYELDFKDDVIKPGDRIRFKGIRGWFIFQRIAHNKKLDRTWIDCVSNMGFHSYSINMLKEVSRPKKSRRKKVA